MTPKMTICFSIFHLLPCRPFSYVKWVSYSTHTIVYILYMILRTVHTVTLFVFIWHREQWGCDERSIREAVKKKTAKVGTLSQQGGGGSDGRP